VAVDQIRLKKQLTASSSLGVNKNLSASLSGIMKTTKKGNTSAAGVDLTIHRMASPMP